MVSVFLLTNILNSHSPINVRGEGGGGIKNLQENAIYDKDGIYCDRFGGYYQGHVSHRLLVDPSLKYVFWIPLIPGSITYRFSAGNT